jgi:hypothetical protein
MINEGGKSGLKGSGRQPQTGTGNHILVSEKPKKVFIAGTAFHPDEYYDGRNNFTSLPSMSLI